MNGLNPSPVSARLCHRRQPHLLVFRLNNLPSILSMVLSSRHYRTYARILHYYL